MHLDERRLRLVKVMSTKKNFSVSIDYSAVQIRATLLRQAVHGYNIIIINSWLVWEDVLVCTGRSGCTLCLCILFFIFLKLAGSCMDFSLYILLLRAVDTVSSSIS